MNAAKCRLLAAAAEGKLTRGDAYSAAAAATSTLMFARLSRRCGRGQGFLQYRTLGSAGADAAVAARCVTFIRRIMKPR